MKVQNLIMLKVKNVIAVSLLQIFILVFALCFFITSNAQDTEFRSYELNKILWKKINNRLEEIGKNKIHVFDTSSMQKFSERVCERLIERDAEFKHSDNDSISMYSGGECILSLIRTSTYFSDIELLTALLSNDLDTIAEKVLKSWVNSDSHREAISEDWYSSTTTYIIIRYNTNEGYFKLSAAWHQKNPFFGSKLE